MSEKHSDWAELDEPEPVREKRGDVRLLPWLVAGVAVLGFVLSAAWTVSRHAARLATGEPPLIVADIEPYKQRPEDPGGMETPYQDMAVYQRLSEEPPPEEVSELAPPPAAPAEEPALADPAGSATPDAAEQAAEAAAANPEPARGLRLGPALRAVPVRPVGSESMPPPTEPPPPPSAERMAQVLAAAPERERLPLPPAEGASPLAEAASEPPSAAEPPAQAPTAETVAAPATVEPDAEHNGYPVPDERPAELAAAVSRQQPESAYRIQLASFRFESEAHHGWTRISQRHERVLSELSSFVERADLGSRGVFFRLQAGPFRSEEAADAACRSLKQARQDCLVVQPR